MRVYINLFLSSTCSLPPSLMVSSLLSLGAAEVEAALGRMIDRCRSGSVKACAEDLVSILGLTDKQAAVTICSLYSQVGFSFFLSCEFVLVSQILFHVSFFPSRMKMWTSDASISALLPCQDSSASNRYFTQLILYKPSLHFKVFYRFVPAVNLQCRICFISALTKAATAV